MAKPHIHALSSVRSFGGLEEDYLPIHEFLDSSKAIVADNRHRAFTHNSWFINTVIPRVFGATITNSDGKVVSTCLIAEQHVLEDYGKRFIPSAQDFLEEMGLPSWIQNGSGLPPSVRVFRERTSKENHEKEPLQIIRPKIQD